MRTHFMIYYFAATQPQLNPQAWVNVWVSQSMCVYVWECEHFC